MALVPTIAWQGTPACRARVAISPAILPSNVVASRRPSPTTTARAARMRASKSSVSRTNGAPGSSRRRTAPTGRRTGRRPRRSSGRRAGPWGARRASRPAAGRASRCPWRRRPSAGRTARRLLERRAHVAQHHEPRAPQPAGLLDRLDRARAAVGRRAAAGGDEDDRGARRRGGDDQLARAARRRRRASRSSGATRLSPLASATSTIAVPPSSISAKPAFDRPPQRIGGDRAARSRRRAR